MKKITLIAITSLSVLFICLVIISCEPETFETPKDQIVPLKMELEKDTVWTITGEQTEIIITSNKQTEVVYTIEKGEIQLKRKIDADSDNKTTKSTETPSGGTNDKDIIKSGSKITLQKGKNAFTVFTDKFQDQGILLHFMPSEKNTSDKNTNHKIQPMPLRVWVNEPDKEEFRVEITHDTPDTLFLQYRPVRFDVKLIPEVGADTSAGYTYEYEIIQGDAVVRIGSAAPNGIRLKPEEKRSMSFTETVTLYATPLTTEPTWIRILVRKNTGITRIRGAYLHLDYIRPRALPGITVSRVENMGSTGNPDECISDGNKNSCMGDRVFYHIIKQNCFGEAGTIKNCYNVGTEHNIKIKHRIYFKQNEYYVPKQKYRLKVDIKGTDLLSKGELSVIPYQGQTVLIDYDSLIQSGYVQGGDAYLDFDINMPGHDQVQLLGGRFKKEWLQIRASLHKEDSFQAGRYFYIAFAKFYVVSYVSIPQPRPPK